MNENPIDLPNTKKIACIGHSSYSWTNIHYNKETNEFISAEYHCSTIDDGEEFCDNISIITLEETLALVYHDAQLMRVVKECVGSIDYEIIKSVANQKKRKQSDSKKFEIMTSGLTSDDNADYYECENGSIFKFGFSTCEYYKYENGYWNSKEKFLFELLNEGKFKYYSNKEWKKHCGEPLPVKVTVNMLTDELLSFCGSNKKAIFGCGICLLIISVCCFVFAFSNEWMVHIGQIIEVCSIPFFVLYFTYKNRIKNIKEHNFYIVEDICVAKNNYVKYIDDNDEKIYEKYFRFKEYGEFKLNNSLYIMYNNGGIENLYLETQAGDKFYLVYVGKGKKAKLIFSERHYELAQFDFVSRKNKLVPYKK